MFFWVFWNIFLISLKFWLQLTTIYRNIVLNYFLDISIRSRDNGIYRWKVVEMTRARALERVNLQGWNLICRQVWTWASTFVSDTLLSEHSFMALQRSFELVSYQTTRARERERVNLEVQILVCEYILPSSTTLLFFTFLSEQLYVSFLARFCTKTHTAYLHI